jgi:hypothetical protein
MKALKFSALEWTQKSFNILNFQMSQRKGKFAYSSIKLFYGVYDVPSVSISKMSH